MAHSRAADMRVTVLRSQRAKDGFIPGKRFLRSANHQTVADFETPDSPAGPRVEKEDPALLERVLPRDGIFVEGVSAVNDRVTLGKQSSEFLYHVLGWRARRNHHPNGSRSRHPGHTSKLAQRT